MTREKATQYMEQCKTLLDLLPADTDADITNFWRTIRDMYYVLSLENNNADTLFQHKAQEIGYHIDALVYNLKEQKIEI